MKAQKNRPILFKGEMVRAILEGRKTQTRRIMKLTGGNKLGVWESDHIGGDGCKYADGSLVPKMPCISHTRTGAVHVPPIMVGDLLWVRESWRPLAGYGAWDLLIFYAADDVTIHLKDGDVDVGDWSFPKAAKNGNVPSIFMPRWASRITLEVTDVRVQRLQDISEEDAIAEGIEYYKDRMAEGWVSYEPKSNPYHYRYFADPRDGFRTLWDSINSKRDEGKYSWKSNPWVVAYTFKPIFKKGLLNDH